MPKLVPHRTVANESWNLWQTDEGKYQESQVTLAVLMDIRQELRRLNDILHCPNLLAVPRKLDLIEKNTRKKRKPRVVGKPKLRVVTR